MFDGYHTVGAIGAPGAGNLFHHHLLGRLERQILDGEVGGLGVIAQNYPYGEGVLFANSERCLLGETEFVGVAILEVEACVADGVTHCLFLVVQE